ncbi:MAG: hypothetical protein ABIJ11_07210 [Elusimicrobiota bacterium]
MQIDKREIESSLKSKGFYLQTDRKHRYFHHTYKGKETGISTYTSHGSSYKTYHENLLKEIKKQLHLDSLKQLRDLLKCPMDGFQYNEILKGKGLIREASNKGK